MKIPVRLFVDLDLCNEVFPGQGNQQAHARRGGIGFKHLHADADVLQALENGHQGNGETGQEHVHRHIAARARQRVIALQDQFLDGGENHVGNGAGDQRRDDPAADNAADLGPLHCFDTDPDGGETDNGAHDGMRGGNRPAAL